MPDRFNRSCMPIKTPLGRVSGDTKHTSDVMSGDLRPYNIYIQSGLIKKSIGIQYVLVMHLIKDICSTCQKIVFSLDVCNE